MSKRSKKIDSEEEWTPPRKSLRKSPPKSRRKSPPKSRRKSPTKSRRTRSRRKSPPKSRRKSSLEKELTPPIFKDFTERYERKPEKIGEEDVLVYAIYAESFDELAKEIIQRLQPVDEKFPVIDIKDFENIAKRIYYNIKENMPQVPTKPKRRAARMTTTENCPYYRNLLRVMISLEKIGIVRIIRKENYYPHERSVTLATNPRSMAYFMRQMGLPGHLSRNLVDDFSRSGYKLG